MSTIIWIIIGVIFVVVWAFIAYEMYNAPIMPDDYGIIEDEDPIFNSETFEEMEARVKDEDENLKNDISSCL